MPMSSLLLPLFLGVGGSDGLNRSARKDDAASTRQEQLSGLRRTSRRQRLSWRGDTVMVATN